MALTVESVALFSQSMRAPPLKLATPQKMKPLRTRRANVFEPSEEKLFENLH